MDLYMKRYREQLDMHPVHEIMSQIIALAETKKDFSSSEEAEENLAFLKAIQLLQQTIDKLDPDLTPWQVLDQINQTLTAHLKAQIKVYVNNGNIQNIINANNHFRQHVLPLLPDLLSLTKHAVREKPLKSAENVATTFIEQIQKKTKNLEHTMDTCFTELAKLEGQIQAYEKPLEAMKQDWKTQYDEWLKGTQKRSNEHIHDHVENSNITIKNAIKKLDEARTDAETTTQEIKEMLGIVTTGVINNDHDKTAKKEMWASIRWRWKTVALLLGAFGWLLYAYSHPPTIPDGASEIYKTWIPLLKTFSLTAILLLTSGFTARQSSSHLENARHLRGVALNVKALDPYLASLDTTQQKELKKELTEKLFGQSYIPQYKKGRSIDENKIIDLMQKILSIAK